jgi:hypothetical protein
VLRFGVEPWRALAAVLALGGSLGTALYRTVGIARALDDEDARR